MSVRPTPTLLLHTHLTMTTLASPDVLTVVITINYTPPPGFTPGPDEYRAASGRVIVTCTATGGAGSGAYQYVWTSTCESCDFQTDPSTGATSVIDRQAVHSGDIGTHTCTASRGGESESDSIVFNVVGEWLLLHVTVCIYWEFSGVNRYLAFHQRCGELGTCN